MKLKLRILFAVLSIAIYCSFDKEDIVIQNSIDTYCDYYNENSDYFSQADNSVEVFGRRTTTTGYYVSQLQQKRHLLRYSKFIAFTQLNIEIFISEKCYNFTPTPPLNLNAQRDLFYINHNIRI